MKVSSQQNEDIGDVSGEQKKSRTLSNIGITMEVSSQTDKNISWYKQPKTKG